MGNYAQFILYKLVPKPDGKTDKLPVDHRTLRVFLKGDDWQQDSTATTTFENAAALLPRCGPKHGIGFFFKKEDPFFFLDIDNCLQDGRWSPTALDITTRLPGAAVEISPSGTGLHIFGSVSSVPEHACKNIPYDTELYTSGRFATLNILSGGHSVGSAAVDCTATLGSVISLYYPPKQRNTATPNNWTTEPVPEYTGPTDDAELVKRACAAKSAAAAFGGSSSFKSLWDADEDAMEAAYPSKTGNVYNESSADAALAQHLAFWTGSNMERMRSIMLQSELYREKWEREDYLPRTIRKAVSMQTAVYSVVKTEPTEEVKSLKLQGSESQVKYGASILSQRIAECKGNKEYIELLSGQRLAKYWIESQGRTVEDIIEALTPVESAKDPFKEMKEPEFSVGFQFLAAQQQADYFKGCIYVQEVHRIFVPSGALLKPDQFNATYGGYSFQFDDGGKNTRKAFEAFVESQVVKYPKAESGCFKPDRTPGELIRQEGRVLVNTYTPVVTKRMKGDVTPFLNHLIKVLPNERDQTILLSFMANCLQNKGVKFQWAPLLQGTPGNGKTLFTRCMIAAIGKKYAHMPRSSEIGEKYNAWVFDKLFIGVEDVYVPEKKWEILEILKPMITGTELERRAMQTDQTMHDICCNFIFNSNHKDAIRKTENDRRFSVFFTAQQSLADLVRDGMDGDYFPDLYDWLKLDGYAIVTDFLYNYQAPEEFNLRAMQSRAPETSSTGEAISISLGGVEQEILEAIDEGRQGFSGGWISSMALELLLKDKRKDGAIPLNKRKEMLETLDYKWHPNLNSGRVNNSVLPDNGKPRLFIKTGHPALTLTAAAEIASAYTAAQLPAMTKAAEVFGNG